MVDYDEIYGCDYSSLGEVTANGDIQTVSGIDNAKQSIRNWLLTDKGFYPSIDTEYGSEIRNIFGEDFEYESVAALIVYIQNALMDNPRVSEITAIEPHVLVDKQLRMNIGVKLVDGTSETMSITLEEEV